MEEPASPLFRFIRLASYMLLAFGFFLMIFATFIPALFTSANAFRQTQNWLMIGGDFFRLKLLESGEFAYVPFPIALMLIIVAVTFLLLAIVLWLGMKIFYLRPAPNGWLYFGSAVAFILMSAILIPNILHACTRQWIINHTALMATIVTQFEQFADDENIYMEKKVNILCIESPDGHRLATTRIDDENPTISTVTLVNAFQSDPAATLDTLRPIRYDTTNGTLSPGEIWLYQSPDGKMESSFFRIAH